MVEPPADAAKRPRAGFFPGSTIGNFEPHEAARFLRHAARILGHGAVFVVGVDLIKRADILYRAYNDAEGVTAKFNLNLLARINRELGANFDLDAFEHHAFYNCERSRIEMHLASTKRQKVQSVQYARSSFVPGKRSIPRTATSIRSSHFAPWPRAAAGRPLRRGRTASSAFMRCAPMAISKNRVGRPGHCQNR
jgi:uncharacterized SAM-dependent methyltransferase